MKFLVDAMLGGLARWLRMLGHDVVYSPDAADSILLETARHGNRILLTRDKELCERATRKALPSLLVLGVNETGRLAEVSRAFNIPLRIDMSITKCPECGSSLHTVSKSDVAGKVPNGSLVSYNEFWQCTEAGCGKIYWMGTHWRQIHSKLEQARVVASKQEGSRRTTPMHPC